MSLRILFLLTAAVFICSNQASSLPSGEASCAPALKIGVILPLSGDLKIMGTTMTNGTTLARKRLPERCRPRLIFEDDAMQQVRSVAAVRKLISQDAVNAIIVFSSGSANAIAPIVENEKVPMLAIASDPQVIRGRTYAFNIWVTPDAEVQIMVPEALRRGYKNIALISSEQDGTLASGEKFMNFSRDKFVVLLDERYSSTERDFRTFVAKMRTRRELDAVLVNLLPGQIGLFAKQAREGGFKGAFFGFENFEDWSEIKTAQGALTGAWFATGGEPGSDFLRDYQREFPGDPSVGAANAYDALVLLVEAFSNRRKPGEAA